MIAKSCYVIRRVEFYDFGNLEFADAIRAFEDYDEAVKFVESYAKTHDDSCEFEWTSRMTYVYAIWCEDGDRIGIRYELEKVQLN